MDNVIYEHVRAWTGKCGEKYTIIGTMAGALIDYHGIPIVHIGVSERHLGDKVDKELGRAIALNRAMDREILYTIYLPHNKFPRRLWEEYIQNFAHRCFLHFRKPVLFPKGLKFTCYPTTLEKKADKNAVPTRG